MKTDIGIKAIALLCAALLVTVMAYGCTGQSPLSLLKKPQESATNTPAPTAQPDPGRYAFGRYAAFYGDTLYYVKENEIMALSKGKTVKLFDLPKDEIFDQIFIAATDTVYFTMSMGERAETYKRKLYKAQANEGVYTVTQVMIVDDITVLAKDSKIYYIKDKALMSLDIITGVSTRHLEFEEIVRLCDWGYFDGKTLYCLTSEIEGSPVPRIVERLIRIDLADLSSTLIYAGGVGKRADQFINERDQVLQLYKWDEKNLSIRIVDSPNGSMDSIITLPRNIFYDINGVRLFRKNGSVYALMHEVISEPQADFTADSFTYTSYKLTDKAPYAEAVWSFEFPHLWASAKMDVENDLLAVLLESYDQGDTSSLYLLNLSDGKLREKIEVPFRGSQYIKEVIIVNGNVLVYTKIGEDYPRPALDSIFVSNT